MNRPPAEFQQDDREDGEELIRRFIEALARDAARYEFRRLQNERETGSGEDRDNKRGRK